MASSKVAPLKVDAETDRLISHGELQAAMQEAMEQLGGTHAARVALLSGLPHWAVGGTMDLR